MIIWLNKTLASVAWWIKIIVMIFSSFVSTLLPLPPPLAFADIAFTGTLAHSDSYYWLLFTILTISITDVIFAVVVYKFANRLTYKIVKSEKKREQLHNIQKRLKDVSLVSNDRIHIGYKNTWRKITYGKIKKIRFSRINKTDLWIFLSAATPLPWTLTVYAASVVEYEKKKMIPLMLIGRIIKYTVLGSLLYLGFTLGK